MISGNGSADDPFIFNCSGDTVVSASFLNHLRSSKSYADFYIYENDILIYAWKVNGSDITEEQTEDWTIGKNVIVNGNGSITVDFSKRYSVLFKPILPKTITHKNNLTTSFHRVITSKAI